MRLVQVVSDFIRRSILTTEGDLVVRGAADPQRLASGLLNTFLAGRGAAELPAWEGHKLSDHHMTIGGFTKSTGGYEVISGLDFRPSIVIFITYGGGSDPKSWSIGWDFFTERMCIISYFGGSAMTINTLWSINISVSVGNQMFGRISAFSDEGFTVYFTETGVSQASCNWLAIE